MKLFTTETQKHGEQHINAVDFLGAFVPLW